MNGDRDMKKIVFVIIGILSFSSAASDITSAQKEIRNQMKDPESAKFKGVKQITNLRGEMAVCGEVNSKNSYGGYVGYKTFAYKSGKAVIDGSFNTPGDYEFFALSGCAGSNVERVALATKQAKAGCQITWEQITDVVLFNKSPENAAGNAITKLKLKNPNLEKPATENMKAQFISSINAMVADKALVNSVKNDPSTTQKVFMEQCIKNTSKSLSGM